MGSDCWVERGQRENPKPRKVLYLRDKNKTVKISEIISKNDSKTNMTNGPEKHVIMEPVNSSQHIPTAHIKDELVWQEKGKPGRLESSTWGE